MRPNSRSRVGSREVFRPNSGLMPRLFLAKRARVFEAILTQRFNVRSNIEPRSVSTARLEEARHIGISERAAVVGVRRRRARFRRGTH